MPDPNYTKPWHGVPREQIVWNPRVDDEACIDYEFHAAA